MAGQFLSSVEVRPEQADRLYDTGSRTAQVMGDGDTVTVLVVEDERPLLEVYSRWLEDSYDVRTAASGSAALERLDESVDVVLLDRRMPGMSGDEVLVRIRERATDCKVAIVSAVEPDFDVITMGFDAYLSKPVRRDELQNVVEQLLARSSFAELEQEFYALVSKQAALESAKARDELEHSEEYAELQERIANLRDDLGEAMPDMDDDAFIAMVRDLEDDEPTEGDPDDL